MGGRPFFGGGGVRCSFDGKWCTKICTYIYTYIVRFRASLTEDGGCACCVLYIQVFAEASIIFPLLVAQTFARDGPREPIK